MSYHVRNVLLEQGQELGFQLTSQSPCIVRSTASPLKYQRSVDLKCGDEILEVNFVNVSSLSAKDVFDMIVQKSTLGKVLLIVRTLFFQNLFNGSSSTSLLESRPRFSSIRRLPPKSGATASSLSINNNSHSNISTRDRSSSYLPNLFGLNSSQSGYTNILRFCKDVIYFGCVSYLFSEIFAQNGDSLESSCEEMFDNYLKHQENNKPSSIKKNQSSNTLILIVINSDGFSLFNLLGKKITTYPLYSLVFHRSFSKDSNYFCIVNRFFTKIQTASRLRHYEFHAFKVDNGLAEHSNHTKLSDMLHLPCNQVSSCGHFPQSSSVVLEHLESLLSER